MAADRGEGDKRNDTEALKVKNLTNEDDSFASISYRRVPTATVAAPETCDRHDQHRVRT